MADSIWRHDLIEHVKEWPIGLRARRVASQWQLQGAGEDMYREVRISAQSVSQHLGFARSKSSMDALLYRLEANGHHVRIRAVRKHAADSGSGYTFVVISPLRDALIEYLQACPEDGHPLPGSLRSRVASPHGDQELRSRARSEHGTVPGQAKAARENHQRAVRVSIIEVFQRLGIPWNKWPDFVRAYCADPQQRIEYTQCEQAKPFHPPEFDRLKQSPEEWRKAADQAWEQHRNEFMQSCQLWVTAGVDERIGVAKRTRGPQPFHAVAQKRNTSIRQRLEWAAKYLMRIPVKEIAAHDGADPSTVGRVAREVLRQAGWLGPAKTALSPG